MSSSYPTLDTDTATLEEILKNVSVRCHEGLALISGDWGSGWTASTCSTSTDGEGPREALVALYHEMVRKGGC